MNEMDELKKRFSESIQIIRNLVSKFFKENWGKLMQKDFRKEPRNLIVGAVVLLFILSSVIGVLKGQSAAVSDIASGRGFSLIGFLLGRSIAVPGKQPDGSFVFSDFESEKDLKAWKIDNAKIEISSRNLAESGKSARVTFYGGREISSIVLQHYFTSRGGLSNWSGFDALQLYIFNPRKEAERLILQVKDQRGIRFKQDLHIPAEKGETFNVPIVRMAGSIDVRKIDQIAIYRWEPRGDLDFYIDEIKLLPEGYSGKQMPQESVGVKVKDRPVKMIDYGFSVRKPFWLVPDSTETNQIVRIPFILKNETAAVCPDCVAGGGIPFPMGELEMIESLRLIDANEKEIPFQARVLAKWPDRSIQWIEIHFQTNLRARDGAGFYLEYGPSIQKLVVSGSIRVDEDNKSIRVHTGKMEAVFDKKSFYLFKKISLDKNQDRFITPDEELTRDAALTLGFHGELYKANLDNKTYQLVIEEKGDRRVVLRASGWFQTENNKRYCQAIVRYHLYEGKSLIKVSHTLVYTGYPENIHYEKYKGLKLPENETIEHFGMTIPFAFSGDAKHGRIQVGQENKSVQDMPDANQFRLFQSGFEQARLEQDGYQVQPNRQFAGWIDVSDESKGMTVIVRNFRENFPKAFGVDRADSGIQIDLWPKEAGELDLATTSNALGPEARGRGSAFGLAKTHELFFHFHSGGAQSSNALEDAEPLLKPLMIRINPYWMDASGVLGRLYPVSDRFGSEEEMLDKLFDWAARQPHDFKWYGMINFGDTLSWWRNEDENWHGAYGWHPTGRWGWYNCEGVGTHMGALIQFIRSGNWKYFEFGSNLAQHIMDVDTVHYNTIANDPRLKNVLDDEVSQVGSMHRHNGDHWGGRNEESSHTSVVGILLYYYLTGDERAFEVAKEIGEFFLTEPYTYTGHPDIAPHRAMANALWGDVLLYQATGDRRYKRAADKLIEIYLKGQQSDGSFLENYNPLDGSWSGSKHQDYMATYALSAFISYHQLTQDEEVKEMLEKVTRYLGSSAGAANALHGLAYVYFISGDAAYLDWINKGMNELLRHRQRSSDSIMDGLIYQKPVYHRANHYLYTVPYAFEALEASQRRPS